MQLKSKELELVCGRGNYECQCYKKDQIVATKIITILPMMFMGWEYSGASQQCRAYCCQELQKQEIDFYGVNDNVHSCSKDRTIQFFTPREKK